MPFPGPFNYLIDSLSDSTIYMAYYTVSHYLCGGARYNGQLPTEVCRAAVRGQGCARTPGENVHKGRRQGLKEGPRQRHGHGHG